MVTMIYFIFITFVILCSRAFIISQTFTYQRSIGQWTETIIGEQGQPNILKSPSRYFICGISTKSYKWQKVLQNCKCSKRWYKWSRQIRCDKCVNYFETKTSGIKAIFCNYDDWSDQITKIIEKDYSPNDGPWRNIGMCPEDMYVNGIAGFLTTQHQTDIGLAGIRVQCSTLSLRNNTILNNPQFSVPLNFPKNGRFFSSFSIKYNGNEVVGLKANFEQPVVISKVQVKYQRVKESIPLKMNVWQSNFANEKTELQTRPIQIKKSVINVISWNIGRNYILGYQFSNSTVLNQPNSLLSDMKLDGSSTNKPKFNTKIELRLTYQNEMTVLIAKCSKLTTKYELMYSKQKIPFEAQITLSGINSQQMIGKQKVVGVWEGNIYNELGVDISQVDINSQKCPGKNIRL